MNIPEGWKLMPVADLIRWRDAFHTELVEWDIDPPLHHVKSSYDEICALLAAPTPPAQDDEALEVLRALLDEQDGPPLLRRAKQWQAAVDAARALLIKRGTA